MVRRNAHPHVVMSVAVRFLAVTKMAQLYSIQASTVFLLRIVLILPFCTYAMMV